MASHWHGCTIILLLQWYVKNNLSAGLKKIHYNAACSDDKKIALSDN